MQHLFVELITAIKPSSVKFFNSNE